MNELKQDKKVWVYDVETLKSCFTYTAINVDTEEIVQYVLHKDRSDWDEFINHLKQCKGQIGFNNLSFDYPVIHYILKTLDGSLKRESTVKYIYEEAQRIIEVQNEKSFSKFASIKESEVLIHQLDLFKIWHYNNAARSTYLKALEIMKLD